MKQPTKPLRVSWGNKHWKERDEKEASVRDIIRTESRAAGYVGTPGMIEYMQETYKAKLRFNRYQELNGIIFKDKKLATLFLLKAGL